MELQNIKGKVLRVPHIFGQRDERGSWEPESVGEIAGGGEVTEESYNSVDEWT